jgi:hypothetical protein
MAYGVAADKISNSSGALSSGVANLTASMDDVLHRLNFADKMAVHDTHSGTISVRSALQTATVLSPLVLELTIGLPSSSASASWATIVTSAAALPESKPVTKPVRQTIQGSRVSSSIQAVMRPITSFVGRFDASTVETDLHCYLHSVGIHNAVCK